MKREFVVLFIMVGMMGVYAGAGEQENQYFWKPQVKSVTVFKNGLGFFLRSGKVSLRDGWAVSEAAPPAAFGTLAIFSHGAKETVDILGMGPGEVVEFNDIDASKDLGLKKARLEASKYLKMQLSYSQQGTERTAAGQLVSIGPEYAVLQAENNSWAVPLEGIRKLQVLERPMRVHVVSDGGKSPAETTLGMGYLRKGITWIPEYTLTLLDEEKAELTLRGTLVNEAENLMHCDVNYVVGVPHFLHTDYLAPVAVGQVIRTIGAAVAPRELLSQMGNNSMIAAAARADQSGIVEQTVRAGGIDLKEATGNLPQWEGAGDFTVYTSKGMTLRLGEKAIVSLFKKQIKYGDFYRWSPPHTIEHFLILNNDTDTAWTTGPCLVMSGGNALSEDLLRYVSKGSKGEIPITTAINMAHDQKETEVDRKIITKELADKFFVDLVTLEGELKVRNYGKKSAEMNIDLQLAGKPITGSHEAKMVIDTTNLKLLDRTGTINWRITIKAGETVTLTYKYERYVPSR